MFRSSRLAIGAVLSLCASASGQDAKTSGNCAPVVINQGGSTNITLVCGDKVSQRDAAKKNVAALLYKLRSLGLTQAYYFMPALDRYATEPTDTNWKLVQVELDRTWNMLQAAIDASLVYAGTIKASVEDPPSRDINKVLGARLPALAELRSLPNRQASEGAARNVEAQANLLRTKITKDALNQDVAPKELDVWMTQYRQLMQALRNQILELERQLDELAKADNSD